MASQFQHGTCNRHNPAKLAFDEIVRNQPADVDTRNTYELEHQLELAIGDYEAYRLIVDPIREMHYAGRQYRDRLEQEIANAQRPASPLFRRPLHEFLADVLPGSDMTGMNQD